MTRTRTIVLTFALGLAAGAFACSPADGDLEFCEGKCDGEDLPFSKKIEKRFDPIAMMFKDGGIEIAEDSSGDVTYRDMVLAMADHQGCGSDSVKTFIISDDLFNPCPVECSEDDPDCKLCSDMTEEERISRKFPRLVSVVCANDAGKNWEFFLNSVSEIETEDGEPTGTIDPRNLEFFGWDPENKTYNFYATFPSDEGDSTFIEVEPQRCQQCHKTPSDTDPVGMPMTPIMNEMNRPWTHWNAEPGFESHDFTLPERVVDMPNFKALAIDHQAPASRFEEIIGTGIHEKVVISRLRERRDPPDIDTIMGLLRPVFCEEHVNYVSEEFEAGVIRNAAMIDPGIRATYHSLDDNWPWEWASIDVMRLGSLNSAESLDQVPTRSHADVLTERQLVTTGAISAEQVLRAKAIDWKNPVFSATRCGLWKQAVERFAAEPPDFGDARRNLEVMGDVFDQILTLDGRSLVVGDGRFVSVDEIDDTSLAGLAAVLDDPSSLAVGDCRSSNAVCMNDLDSFGALIDAYVTETEALTRPRTRIRRLRNERICEVKARFPNRPSLPEVTCD